uniref:Uncharacterized protein n=1 Tax=Vitis vinifera TaxID=29760 RepID=F6GYX1_VITVI
MTLMDYFLKASKSQTHLNRIIGGLSTTQEPKLQCLVHQLQLSDGALDTSTSTLAAPSSPDHMSLMTLYFPDEVDEHGTFVEIGDIVDGVVPHDEFIDEMLAISLSQIEEIVQPELASPFDLFGVFVIEIVEEILTAPAPKSIEDVLATDDLFDGPINPVEGASDFRVSPPTEDVEVVDFGTADQPKELRIGLDLFTYERDDLVRLLRSYLDVFAWSYEDMPDLDPSIVQHHLPLLPQARPIK